MNSRVHSYANNIYTYDGKYRQQYVGETGVSALSVSPVYTLQKVFGNYIKFSAVFYAVT